MGNVPVVPENPCNHEPVFCRICTGLSCKHCGMRWSMAAAREESATPVASGGFFARLLLLAIAVAIVLFALQSFHVVVVPYL